MRFSLTIVLAALAFSSFAAGAKISKVSTDNIEGNKLIAKTDNFSIVAPNNSWQWHEFRKSSIVNGYLLINEATEERFLITINNKTYPPVNENVAKYYIGKISKSYSASGGKVSNVEYHASNSPLKSSYYITYNSEKADGKLFKTYTKLFTNKKLYMLSYSTNNPTRKKERIFKKFSASFKALK